MNIVFAINKSYKDILSVLLLSILENNKQEFIHFYILTTDFNEEDKKNYDFLHKLYKNFEISFLKPDADRFKDLKLNIDYISIETYYRYLIAELLPTEDRALYLDADMVVNGSLSELYHTELGDNYIAGVRDAYIMHEKYLPDESFKPDDLYINAGMLLCNLSKMREDKLADKLLENTIKYFDKIKYQDQDIINITCKGKIKEVDCIYNFTSYNTKIDKRKIKQAVIIHYTGKLKAWDKESKNKLNYIWKNYEKKVKGLKNINIFICYHKLPIYPHNDILVPLHVGKGLVKDDFGIIGDNTEDNISEKNPYYCELTAMYWIWKNIKTDVVGLFHYRRYLNFKNNEGKFYTINDSFFDKFGLNHDTISEMLSNFDLLVPKKVHLDESLYDYYSKAHVISDLDLVLDVIKKKYPNMKELAENTLKTSFDFYPANMLVCKKKIFDEYSEWLFSILFEVEKIIQADVLQRDNYQQRVYGFLSERLMAVFIATHPNLKIKELPLLYKEEDIKKWRKYRYKQIKRKILTFLGLGKEKWKK